MQSRLRNEYQAAGKQLLYERLQPYLVGNDAAEPYDEVAAALAMSVGAVKTAVYRMRLRYGQLLRNEISHTVTSQDELDDEVRRLFAVLS